MSTEVAQPEEVKVTISEKTDEEIKKHFREKGRADSSKCKSEGCDNARAYGSSRSSKRWKTLRRIGSISTLMSTKSKTIKAGEYELLNVGDIKPYEKNAKKHSKKQVKEIAASIKAFGFNQPIVIDDNNVVIVGHGRLEGAKLAGLATVPVIRAKLTENQAKAYRLADNKLNESPWEMELVIEELRSLTGGMYGLTGFNMDTIVDPREKDDTLPERPPAISKLGEVYALGDHRIICADSTDENAYVKMVRGKVAMTFTDPPYNMNYRSAGGGRKRQPIENDKMSSPDFKAFLKKAFEHIVQYTAGGIYICMSPKELGNAKDAFTEAGGFWQSTIIWVKQGFNLSGSDYQPGYEPILYGFSKKSGGPGKRNHYFIDRRDISNVWEDISTVKAEYDGSYTTISFQGFKVKIPGKIEKGSVIKKKQHMDVFRHDKPAASPDHPTTKPVSLVTEALVNSSKEGEIILDPFLGSGTTLIACEKTGRVCYGMELDPHYVDVAIARWEEYTGLKAKKIS